MAVKSKTALNTDIDTLLASNVPIVASVHRGLEKDIVASYEDFVGSYTTAQIAALVGMTLRQRVFNTTDNDYEWHDGVRWVKEAHPKYKLYKALMAQTGTSAPTVQILENNIGTIVWTWDSTGFFKGTLSNAFTANKTFFDTQTDAGLVAGSEVVLNAGWIDASNILIGNLDGSFSSVDGLGRGYVTIQVYY